MQVSPPSPCFVSLRLEYLHEHPVLNKFQLVSFLIMRDQFSHPIKTKAKIVVLFILLFIFLL